MSGSFEKLSYDVGAYATRVKESTDPLKRMLDPVFSNQCNPCRPPEPGYIGKVGVSITHQRPLIDVDSSLKNLEIRHTKDPNQLYQPVCPSCGECSEGYPCGGGVVAGCKNCQEKLFHLTECKNSTDYTRISNPTCTLRGTGVNRFQPLCLNPQDEDRWLHPSEVGISYRMVVKDNHTPCIPNLVDPTPALPKGGELPCPPIIPTCANHVKPLHNHYKGLNRNWNGLN
jgi:hypothetical protein